MKIRSKCWWKFFSHDAHCTYCKANRCWSSAYCNATVHRVWFNVPAHLLQKQFVNETCIHYEFSTLVTSTSATNKDVFDVQHPESCFTNTNWHEYRSKQFQRCFRLCNPLSTHQLSAPLESFSESIVKRFVEKGRIVFSKSAARQSKLYHTF